MYQQNSMNNPDFSHSNAFSTETTYQCQYCREYFTPTKRFVQKYCSESCRVMACRERSKSRLGKIPAGTGNGYNPGSKNSKNLNIEAQEQLMSGIISELKDYFEDREKKLLKKLQAIQSNQQNHMLISTLVPFVAEPLRQKIASLLNKKTSMQELDRKGASKVSGLPDLPLKKPNKIC